MAKYSSSISILDARSSRYPQIPRRPHNEPAESPSIDNLGPYCIASDSQPCLTIKRLYLKGDIENLSKLQNFLILFFYGLLKRQTLATRAKVTKYSKTKTIEYSRICVFSSGERLRNLISNEGLLKREKRRPNTKAH